MVNVRIGNLFDSKAQTLVNTVNCVGVMGKGVALEFKERFPEMFEDYQRRCERGEVRLGEPYIYKPLLPPWILNFPTKDHWRSVSRLDDIVRGLQYVERHCKEWGVTSLGVPPLGCGHGQLEWCVVGPTLYRHLSRLDIPIELFAPFGTASAELSPAFLTEPARSEAPNPNGASASQASRIPAAWVGLVAVVKKIQQEPYHWPVGRITFQKIAYFATISGVPTGLEYARSSYGPFARGVKPMVAKLVNNGLVVERRSGQMFTIEPGPTFGDALKHFRSEIEQWGPALSRVTDLVLRMRTSDVEIAATVVHVARDLATAHPNLTEAEVLEEVFSWKKRRRPPLDRTEVASAVRSLNVLGWVHLAPSDDLPVPEEAF